VENNLLFHGSDDYNYFVEKFHTKSDKNNIEVYAFCLMPNHFHFCLKQITDDPLFKSFNSFLTSYVMHVNHKYKRRGKLFASKLQHKLITKDEYLIQLCRYIHYNPVKAELVSHVEDWRYSNFLEYIGKRETYPYSRTLINTYPDEFKDYDVSLQEYEKYIKNKEFNDLLFD
jgi:putative transposase